MKATATKKQRTQATGLKSRAAASPRQIRFDPVTVRAAARIQRLASRGTIYPYEVDLYLRQFAATQVEHRALHRLARKVAGRFDPGLTRPFALERVGETSRAAAQSREEPACLS